MALSDGRQVALTGQGATSPLPPLHLRTPRRQPSADSAGICVPIVCQLCLTRHVSTNLGRTHNSRIRCLVPSKCISALLRTTVCQGLQNRRSRVQVLLRPPNSGRHFCYEQDLPALFGVASVTGLISSEGQETPVRIAFFAHCRA